MRRHAGISAVYSGHDHDNDYLGVKEGVRWGVLSGTQGWLLDVLIRASVVVAPCPRLAYGRKSGWGGYGPPQGWLRGARVIELRMGQDTAHR